MTLQSLYKNGSSNQIPIPIKKKKKKWTQIPLIFYITLGMWFCGRINYSSTLRNPASLSNCASWKGWQLSWKFRSHIRSVCRMEMRYIVRTLLLAYYPIDINVSRQWSTIFTPKSPISPWSTDLHGSSGSQGRETNPPPWAVRSSRKPGYLFQ